MNNWRQTLMVKQSGYAADAVKQGNLSPEELAQLKGIDPTPNKKYVNWMAKIWISEHPSIDDLKNYIEEYNTAVARHLSETADIFSLKTFDDLKRVVDSANDKASASLKDLEKDYEVLVDNPDLLVIVPYTHEASRKVGLKDFAFKPTPGGAADCPWCTTNKNSSHYNSYFYDQQVTFYYVKIRSEQLLKKLKQALPGYDCRGFAIVVHTDGQIEVYDASDKVFVSKLSVTKLRKIIGL